MRTRREQNMIKIFKIFYDFTQRVTGILFSLGDPAGV